MVHFRLDPEKFLSLDEAWKRACSRLGSYDGKAARADEALARRGQRLIDRSADLERRGRDLCKRIADETITDDERATAEAELSVADTELADTEAVLNDKLAVRTDKYAAEERRIERLMRDALADGLLLTWIEGPDGQPKCLLDREAEAWRKEAFGSANIASIPDLEVPSFNPGPDTEGKPAFVEKSVFENWLEPAPSTPVAEPAAVVGAAESLPGEPPVSAAGNTSGETRKRGPKALKSKRIAKEMRDELREKRLTPGQLESMIEKEGEKRYSCSRYTFRNVRHEVLSEIVDRQITTNDKSRH
jgi:hypothetical protein